MKLSKPLIFTAALIYFLGTAAGNPIGAGESAGACETYKELSGVGDEELSCSPGPNYDACGDQFGEVIANVKGPAVDESVLSNYPAHYETCMKPSEYDQCVLPSGENGAEKVPEGTMANIAPKFNDAKYQDPDNSPDWSVCLDTDSEPAGKWYSLDNQDAEDYILNNMDIVNNGDDTDPSELAYYWQNNPNPQHPQFNPKGNQEGIALEDDCDSDLNGCEHTVNSDGLFYSFFRANKRDKDYNPQGDSSEGDSHVSSAYYNGYINRLWEDSRQLEPGMNTTVYSMPEDSDSNTVTLWNDSIGTEDRADQWGITSDLTKCVSARGNAFEIAGNRFDYTGSDRTSTDDPTIRKLDRAMGNSLCVVSKGYNNYRGENIPEGFGVWINPDNLRQGNLSGIHSYDQYSNWTDLLDNEGFEIDITGPDSGLGFKETDNYGSDQFDSFDNERVFVGDIKFNDSDELDPPMCGDDEKEYLLEEKGESSNAGEGSGPFVCANTNAKCVSYGSPGGPFFDTGDYIQVNEPGEDDGRLKDDKEVCQQRPGEEAMWFDQDYGEVGGVNICRENILFGQPGVQWFNHSYIQEHPKAVTGGIDDSWNAYFEQEGQENLTSLPQAQELNSTHSPVDTGTLIHDKVAVPDSGYYGFCGGDDESEYLVTQDCNTRFCDTNRDVIGVSAKPDACIFDEDKTQYETDSNGRTLFDSGEEITITSVQSSPTIRCFGGTWFSDWPVSFKDSSVDVPLGETRTTTFQVINTLSQQQTFEVVMENNNPDSLSAYQFASFVGESGDSFTTTIPAQSSQEYRVEFTGGNSNLNNGELFVRAEGVNSNQIGSDSVKVSITENNETGTGQTQDIPGITTLQVVVIFLISTLVYLRS